jgi:hypothetical protein
MKMRAFTGLLTLLYIFYKLESKIKKGLNFVGDKRSLANAFPDEEPASDLECHQSGNPSFLKRNNQNR